MEFPKVFDVWDMLIALCAGFCLGMLLIIAKLRDGK